MGVGMCCVATGFVIGGRWSEVGVGMCCVATGRVVWSGGMWRFGEGERDIDGATTHLLR